MSHWDATGYFAAGMVFVAFGMKDMIPRRIVAMLSNLAFVTYGWASTSRRCGCCMPSCFR